MWTRRYDFYQVIYGHPSIVENKIKEEEEARAAAGGDASSSQEEMLGLKELASQELAQIETMIGDLLEWLQIDEDLSTLGLPEPELEQLDGAPGVTAQQTGGGERAKEALKKRGVAAGAKQAKQAKADAKAAQEDAEGGGMTRFEAYRMPFLGVLLLPNWPLLCCC